MLKLIDAASTRLLTLKKPNMESFRRQLEKRRQELLGLAETRKSSQETVELDQTRQGRLSRMDALQGQAMARAAEARAAVEMRKIEAALARCDAGDYGYCLECGEEIAQRRLEFDPTTMFCIACAEAREHKR